MAGETELAEKISAFLDDRKLRVDGGWPKVTKDELDALREITGDLLDLKYERDVDNDRAVTARFTDLTSHEHLRYRAVPRLPDEWELDLTSPEVFLHWTILSLNSAHAHEAQATFFRLMQHDYLERRKREDKDV